MTIKDGEKTTFLHKLSAEDIKTAIDTGFDFTVIVSSEDVSDAEVVYSDPRAEHDATEDLVAVYTPAVATECAVEVRDFCLIDVVGGEDGRSSFTFQIDVVASPVCTSLSASLDIVNQNGEYLGNVSITKEELLDTIECDCDKEFTVTADSASTGRFYGQLDIRDANSGLVEIQDSCEFDSEA